MEMNPRPRLGQGGQGGVEYVENLFRPGLQGVAHHLARDVHAEGQQILGEGLVQGAGRRRQGIEQRAQGGDQGAGLLTAGFIPGRAAVLIAGGAPIAVTLLVTLPIALGVGLPLAGGEAFGIAGLVALRPLRGRRGRGVGRGGAGRAGGRGRRRGRGGRGRGGDRRPGGRGGAWRRGVKVLGHPRAHRVGIAGTRPGQGGHGAAPSAGA